MNKIIYSLLAAIYLAIPAITYSHGSNHLGHIEFIHSGNALAKPYFDNGLMLLHSFQYDEARAAFKKAQEKDADFALAYWGEAMTYNHPLWVEQEKDKAVSNLKRLAATAEERVNKAHLPVEKGLMSAVNILFADGDKVARDKKYLCKMKSLYQQFPDNSEIAILYSLALLGSAETERDYQIYMQAAGVAEDIYERNKSHPGALHYIIHAYDDPIHAPLGLRAARAYSKVAPNASHALHMPSHIFMALGMWDDVIQSNQAAWDAGLKLNPKADPSKYTIHDLHALQWLAYGYLQKKIYKKAFELTKIMESIALKNPSPMTKWYYAIMRAAYLSDSREYEAKLVYIPANGVETTAIASNAYANALIAMHKGDIKKMRRILNLLIANTPKTISNHSSNDYFSSVTKSGITTAKITALQIKALIGIKTGNIQKALLCLKEASDFEESLSFGYGPPLPVKPSFELYAETLAHNHEYKKAYQYFIVTLKRMPKRLNAHLQKEGITKILNQNGIRLPQENIEYFNRLIQPDFFH